MIGATISTAGKATAQLGSHDPIQAATNPSLSPITRRVEMPETMKDINPDRINPNNTGANRAGIMAFAISGLMR